MPQPRYRLVDTQTTPFYHCISRCVRRAFLCGYDKYSRKNFDHRKQWILDRIKEITSVFSIDVCAYAIMSNHLHLVLHVDTRKAQLWPPEVIIDQWLMLYKGPAFVQRYAAGEQLTQFECEALDTWVETIRGRLSDISWFMRCLNETIARMANKEDDCTGRFWEGRFRSQALLDEAAVVSCMAYVDLNPVRAKVCETLEQSEFTSIQERLRTFTDNPKDSEPCWLAPMAATSRDDTCPIPICYEDYLSVVDWTGRAIRANKRGSIPPEVQPVLEKLGINPSEWVNHTQLISANSRRAIGSLINVKAFAKSLNQKWLVGVGSAKLFYN